MTTHTIETTRLNLAFEDSGPRDGATIILVHGWPDFPRTWDKVLPALHKAGVRTITPYLRGYGPSTFRDHLFSSNPKRTGQPVAFAQDILDLADALDIERFHFVGHDWGARTGYVLVALFTDRLLSHIAIAVPFEPGKAKPPKLSQARAFWYQWLLCTIPGEELFREDPVAYGLAQWDAWSPEGWYTQSEFEEAAESWKSKSFQEVVLHGYRSRWGHAELDPDYQDLQERYEATNTIDFPTVLIHGSQDHCELLETTDGAERHFTRGYERIVIDKAGHFVQRESAQQVAAIILQQIESAETNR